VIAVPAGVRILLAARPVDFRRGAHALAASAAEVLGEDPFSGVVLVFRAKRADRVKILVWDTTGLVLVWKQLQQGGFRWPPVTDGVVRLSAAQFAALFGGLDWTRLSSARAIHEPSAAA
jgi:transposase